MKTQIILALSLALMNSVASAESNSSAESYQKVSSSLKCFAQLKAIVPEPAPGQSIEVHSVAKIVPAFTGIDRISQEDYVINEGNGKMTYVQTHAVNHQTSNGKLDTRVAARSFDATKADGAYQIRGLCPFLCTSSPNRSVVLNFSSGKLVNEEPFQPSPTNPDMDKTPGVQIMDSKSSSASSNDIVNKLQPAIKAKLDQILANPNRLASWNSRREKSRPDDNFSACEDFVKLPTVTGAADLASSLSSIKQQIKTSPPPTAVENQTGRGSF